jgi:uncharacterized protein (UPF0332 family)
MNDAARALAEYRIQRARETLEDAATLADLQRWNGAVNRLYYAAFYAAKALLATRELDTARHSAAISLFQVHFVKSGIIPAELARALPRTFEMRQDTDYSDYEEATAEDVQPLRRTIVGFVEACERALNDMLRPG